MTGMQFVFVFTIKHRDNITSPYLSHYSAPWRKWLKTSLLYLKRDVDSIEKYEARDDIKPSHLVSIAFEAVNDNRDMCNVDVPLTEYSKEERPQTQFLWPEGVKTY
jgi:hypothetical protein